MCIINYNGRQRKTPYDFTFMWNLKTKYTKEKRLINAENKLMVARWREFGEWVKKLKRLRSTNGQLENSHGDVKCSLGNIVDNVVKTIYGARWVLDLWGITS